MPTRQAAASAEHLHNLFPRHRSHQALSAALSARRTAGSLLGPVAVALLGLWGPPALAQFSSSGAVNVYPGNALVPNGAGNVDLGNVGLFIGDGFSSGVINRLGVGE